MSKIKITNFKLVLFLIFVTILACNSNITKATANRKSGCKIIDSSHSGIKYHLYDVTINASMDYCLNIRTIYIYDTLKPKESFLFDQNDVVVSQELTFFHGDTLLKKTANPSPYLLLKVNNLKRKVLDNVISWVGVINNKDDFFFNLHGTGGCNTCSESLYFYSKNGEKLWSIYSKKSDNILEEQGRYDDIMRKYKVEDSIRKSKKIEYSVVFPPFNCGEKIHGAFR